MCFCLVGCQVHSSQPLSSQSHENHLIEKFINIMIIFYIFMKTMKSKMGFTFFNWNSIQSGIGDFATYQDDSHQQATCILSHQKDCQLTFTFGKDYVIVKTTDEVKLFECRFVWTLCITGGFIVKNLFYRLIIFFRYSSRKMIPIIILPGSWLIIFYRIANMRISELAAECFCFTSNDFTFLSCFRLWKFCAS